MTDNGAQTVGPAEYYCELIGEDRDDGRMFVTSRSLPLFSAVVDDKDWESVLTLIEAYLEKNVGEVKSLRLVTDVSIKVAYRTEPSTKTPPPHVIAELAA